MAEGDSPRGTGDFLQFLRDAKRGHLKVYLGMAAGVGKTVAMLREGKRLATEGMDVISGIVEREQEEADRGVADAERVMVCMSSVPSATRRLLRRGARLAGGLNSVWFVVYVRTPSESPQRIETAALRSLSDNITLAKELGAEVVRLEGADVAEALARFARERDITHAVFGRTREPPWLERLRGSLVDRFMRLAPTVDVLVVGAAGDE